MPKLKLTLQQVKEKCARGVRPRTKNRIEALYAQPKKTQLWENENLDEIEVLDGVQSTSTKDRIEALFAEQKKTQLWKDDNNLDSQTENGCPHLSPTSISPGYLHRRQLLLR
jgi:hypothetical protein